MIRIIGGTLRGRKLEVPSGPKVRPSADRVREALFNMLDHRLHWQDFNVLDLYAGSGALGIEALSRGARFATFVESSKALTRSGARPGDGVYVSGTIGDAGLCFWKLSNDLIPSNQELQRLNCPTPRVELGLLLKDLASACLDISDGLEQDLSHILKASSVGAVIEVEKIPISEALLDHIKDTNDWSIPLCGGDDYELCFTIPKGNEEALKKISKSCNVKVTKIGIINESLGLQIEGFDGPRKSYQHF